MAHIVLEQISEKKVISAPCIDISLEQTLLYANLLRYNLKFGTVTTHLYTLHCNGINYPNNTPGTSHSQKRMTCIAIVGPCTSIKVFICLRSAMLRTKGTATEFYIRCLNNTLV